MEPLDALLAVYLPVLSGIRKQYMHQSLQLLLVQGPNRKNLSNLHIIIALPLENPPLRRILLRPPYLDPIRGLQQRILSLIHEPIDEPRAVGLGGRAHELVE